VLSGTKKFVLSVRWMKMERRAKIDGENGVGRWFVARCCRRRLAFALGTLGRVAPASRFGRFGSKRTSE